MSEILPVAGVLTVALIGLLHASEVLGITPVWTGLAVCTALMFATGRAQQLAADADLLQGMLIGVPLGLGLYVVSTAVATRSPVAALTSLLMVRTPGRHMAQLAPRLARQTGIVLWEECLYRGTLLVALGLGVVGVLVSSVVFAAMHWPKVRDRSQLSDLFLMGVILCTAFMLWPNILIIAVAHWVRNALVLTLSATKREVPCAR